MASDCNAGMGGVDKMSELFIAWGMPFEARGVLWLESAWQPWVLVALLLWGIWKASVTVAEG